MSREFRLPGWSRIAVGVAIALGLFFRFDNLSGKEFWGDEVLGRLHALGYTEAQIVLASPQLTHAADLQRYLDVGPQAGPIPDVSATVRSLALEDPQHPPAYYVLAHLWTGAFGGGISSVRALSAIFGALAIPCFWLLAAELFKSRSVAWVASALFAVSPFFVLYAQEAREYSMWSVVVLIDGWLILRALRTPSAAWWIAYGTLAAVSLYIDPLSALVIVGFALYALIAERFRWTQRVVGCVSASVAALTSFAPWAYVMLTSAGLGRGMAGIMSEKLGTVTIATLALRNLRAVFFDFGLFRVGPFSSAATNGVFTLAVLVAVSYAFVRLVRVNAFRVWGFVIVGLCLPLSLLVLDDLLIHGRFVYQMRYFTPAIIGIVLALANLVRGESQTLSAAPRRGAAVAACLTVLAIGGVLSCVSSARSATWWNKDYEQSYAVARAINAADRPLVTSDYEPDSVLALAYNLDPRVAVRLNLRCAQCTLPDPPPRDLLAADAGYGEIFILDDMPPAVGASTSRYIDPHPFPKSIEKLAMFAFVK